MNKFPEMLRYLRKRSGLTQKELAKGLNIAESTVSMWETGRREPEQENMEAIADYFNVNMDVLFGREKPATENGDGLTEFDLDLIRRLKALNPDQIAIVESLVRTFQAGSKE